MSTVQPNLTDEEARRALQHDYVKGGVVDDVNAEIADRAARARYPGEEDRLARVAGSIRAHAVEEAIDSEHAAERSRGLARVSQFVDYAFFLVYALLATRFVLVLIGARASTGFVKMIGSISDPLYAPFRNIVDSPQVGQGHLASPIIVALVAYMVLHFAINRLLRMFVMRKTEI